MIRPRPIKENEKGLFTRRFRLTILSIFGFFALLITFIIKTNSVHVRRMNASGLIGEDENGLEHLHGQMSPVERNILESHYFLIDVTIPASALRGESGGDDYGPGVKAIFCPIDWHLQKSDPSSVSMFRFLVSASKHCKPNRVTADLSKIVAKARHVDETMPTKTKSLELQGVVFHETRCGSTLIANLLSGESNRVYSESPPPITALKACEGRNDCNPKKQDALLRDIVYMMGRTNQVGVEHNLFLKIQSVGVRDIDVFTRAFPETPWVFVYRDSVEVMMSHFKNPESSKGANAVCLRSKRMPPKLLKDIVKERGRTVKSLTDIEFCAAHLATLCESALLEYDHQHMEQAGVDQSGSMGKFVNYATLPDALWEDVLPHHFGIGPSANEVERMKEIATKYSKSGGRSDVDTNWEDDTKRKQERANNAVRAASELFLKPYYDRLEELSNTP